jgi:hypothetical protein
MKRMRNRIELIRETSLQVTNGKQVTNDEQGAKSLVKS